VATLREALNSSEEEIAQLKAQMQVLVQEKQNLEQEHRQTFEDRSVLQSRIQGMEVQIQELKESASAAGSIRQNPLQQRVRELSDRMDQMRDSMKEKDQQIANAKKREAVSSNDLKKIEKEKNDLKKQLQRLTSTYNTAQEGRAAKIARLESTIQEKQKEIDRLSPKGLSKPKETVAFNSERQSLNKQIAVLKENLKKEQSAYENKLEKAKTPYLLQIESLQRSLDEKNAELQKKNKQMESLNAKTKTLSEDLMEIKEQKGSFDRSVQALEKIPKKCRVPNDLLKKRSSS
jgi:chromosome segregation ATPase